VYGWCIDRYVQEKANRVLVLVEQEHHPRRETKGISAAASDVKKRHFQDIQLPPPLDKALHDLS
ncbi:hypothetical protein V6144_15780, partial [Klebsiella pneumoniae]